MSDGIENCNKITFEDVEKIFKCYRYWSTYTEEYWYENMWGILERKGLTAFDTDEQYCNIIFMAVALILIFTDHVALKYDECDLHDDIYSNVLSDFVNEFNLGALYYKYAHTLDGVNENYDYVAGYIAEQFRDKVYSAIHNELGTYVMFLSMEAVDEGFTYIEQEYNEDGDEYYSEGTYFPNSAKEFWDKLMKNIDDVAAKAENYSLDISSTVYGWVEDGCNPVI